MGRYRQYKNGIYGHRLKGYYIVKDSINNKYDILDENAKSVLEQPFNDYSDAEWWIEKRTATPHEIELIQRLYSTELFKLSGLMLKFIEKRDREGLTLEEDRNYELVVKVRARKAKDKPY